MTATAVVLGVGIRAALLIVLILLARLLRLAIADKREERRAVRAAHEARQARLLREQQFADDVETWLHEEADQ